MLMENEGLMFTHILVIMKTKKIPLSVVHLKGGTCIITIHCHYISGYFGLQITSTIISFISNNLWDNILSRKICNCHRLTFTQLSYFSFSLVLVPSPHHQRNQTLFSSSPPLFSYWRRSEVPTCWPPPNFSERHKCKLHPYFWFNKMCEMNRNY